MAPLFFTLGNLLQLMIVRDSEPQSDGQSVLKNTYSIFQDMALRDPRQSKSKEGILHLERIKDPEYYGFLSPAAIYPKYSYTADGLNKLTEDEAEQLIEQIKDW